MALELPADARAALGRTIEALRPSLGAASIPPVENLHCTIAFLDEVEDVDAIATALQGVRSDGSIETALSELGVFPNARRARVVWAGLADADGKIAAVARSVSEALAPHGFEPEHRPFSAHVTLARLRAPHAVTLDATIEPVGFEVGHITLMQSVLRGSKHPVYEPIARFLLDA